jgi:hypothetical protein
MATESQRFVPKVHPLDRDALPEDPLTLHATPAEGDPEVMLECLVQEYVWMGWEPGQVLGLFRDPFYPALNGLLCLFGEEGVRARVAAVFGRMGVFRFRGAVRDEPEPAEPELIQLGLRTRAKGDSHAQGR